ncbi:MAG: mobile mystery protein B [Chloroflexota bacterium]
MSDSGHGDLVLGAIGPEPEGATPIEAEDLNGLIPEFVATRADLNQVEYENIAKALPWAARQARVGGVLRLFDYAFVFELHRQMFGDVWTWAGSQRRLETNMGASPHQIPTALRQALDDARYWHEHDVYPVDHRAARIHYRLVLVHPFPNGNGRCTRLIADLYLRAVGSQPFSWATGRLDDGAEAQRDVRRAYVAALEAAPADDCDALVTFARS